MTNDLNFQNSRGNLDGAPFFALGAHKYRAGLCDIRKLSPHPRNHREHPRRQIAKLKRSISNGFFAPIIADET